MTNPRSNETLELTSELMKKILITLARRSKGNAWDLRTTHQVADDWAVYNFLAGTAMTFTLV